MWLANTKIAYRGWNRMKNRIKMSYSIEEIGLTMGFIVDIAFNSHPYNTPEQQICHRIIKLSTATGNSHLQDWTAGLNEKLFITYSLIIIILYIVGICEHDRVSCEKASASYRTADGSCNNIEHPEWGKASRPLNRLLISDYCDGILCINTKKRYYLFCS